MKGPETVFWLCDRIDYRDTTMLSQTRVLREGNHWVGKKGGGSGSPEPQPRHLAALGLVLVQNAIMAASDVADRFSNALPSRDFSVIPADGWPVPLVENLERLVSASLLDAVACAIEMFSQGTAEESADVWKGYELIFELRQSDAGVRTAVLVLRCQNGARLLSAYTMPDRQAPGQALPPRPGRIRFRLVEETKTLCPEFLLLLAECWRLTKNRKHRRSTKKSPSAPPAPASAEEAGGETPAPASASNSALKSPKNDTRPKANPSGSPKRPDGRSQAGGKSSPSKLSFYHPVRRSSHVADCE